MKRLSALLLLSLLLAACGNRGDLVLPPDPPPPAPAAPQPDPPPARD
jgi:predicted small lipoprotein YifL